MSSNLPTRILGTLGIHAGMGGAFWAITRFGFARQESLAPDLVDRLDGDPIHVAAYVDDITKQILLPGLGGLIVAAVLASFWLLLLHRNPPYGDKSARAKRGSWAGLLVLAIAAALVLFWVKLLGASTSMLLASSVPVSATAVGMLLLVAAYWLSTAIFAPSSTKVAVPGAGVFGA